MVSRRLSCTAESSLAADVLRTYVHLAREHGTVELAEPSAQRL